jgi:hypothetical protein
MTYRAFHVISAGLALGLLAVGPALAYEYGWIVARYGRPSEPGTIQASRSAAVGVWMGIASASGVRTGGAIGPWTNLAASSHRYMVRPASPSLPAQRRR